MYIDVENLLNLSAVSGVGSGRLRALIGRFKEPARVFKASISALSQVDGIDRKIAEQIRLFSDFAYGKQQLGILERINSRVVTFWDKEYPDILKRIYDPPAILFVKGRIEKQDANAIAIVGSRGLSDYGKMVTESITRGLSQYGITIISGLARGVDTVAHWSALHCQGRTIAVLGNGLDKIYPPENRGLAERIVENGALVTEFPCGVGPDAVNFPRRNRIIAGLSLGTVVTEAGIKSGALITAHMAVESNRDVFAVPGHINSKKSEGCHRLIKEGAQLVTSADEIIDELLPQLKNDNDKHGTAPKVQLSSDEEGIMAHLSAEPIHIDVLARKIGKSTSAVLTVLLMLEMKDCVRQLPGKYFVLSY